MYLVAMIGLVTFIFGSVGIINNVFKNFVFQVDYDYYIDAMPGRSTCEQAYLDPSDASGKNMISPTSDDTAKCELIMNEQRAQGRRNNIGNDFSIAIAQIGVGLPIWLFHWSIIQKEYRSKREEEDINV